MHFWFLNVIVPPICYDVWRPSKWYGRCCHGTWDGIFCVSKNRLEMLEFTGNPMLFLVGVLVLSVETHTQKISNMYTTVYL